LRGSFWLSVGYSKDSFCAFSLYIEQFRRAQESKGAAWNQSLAGSKKVKLLPFVTWHCLALLGKMLQATKKGSFSYCMLVHPSTTFNL